MYASVNRDSIGSDNGLSLIRRQAISWANAQLDSWQQMKFECKELKLNLAYKIAVEISQQFQHFDCLYDANVTRSQ